jgi:polyisoprenoid-binding protein YceI
VKKLNDGELEISGNMNIKGIENPVTLLADFAGIAVDPFGQTKAGMSITGKIKRSEFGLTWSAVTEAGNIVLGDEISLNCEVQFIKQ